MQERSVLILLEMISIGKIHPMEKLYVSVLTPTISLILHRKQELSFIQRILLELTTPHAARTTLLHWRSTMKNLWISLILFRKAKRFLLLIHLMKNRCLVIRSNKKKSALLLLLHSQFQLMRLLRYGTHPKISVVKCLFLLKRLWLTISYLWSKSSSKDKPLIL